MALDQASIKRRIAQALSGRNLDDDVLSDVAFHMTDWLDDLEGLYRFFSAPKSVEPTVIEDLLVQFLIHVPNHVAAAAKLLVDFPVADIFEVGAVDMTTEEKVRQLRLHLDVWGEHQALATIDYPSDLQIAEALQSLGGDKLFGASIGLHNSYYLLVNRCRDANDNCFRWVVDDVEHNCVNPNPPLEDLIGAFQQFAKGDHSWKQDFVWQR